MQAENRVLRECMLALSEAGCIVWRNDSGAYRTETGRLIRYGLCKGSADLIGIAPDGVFLAIECKTGKGRASADQKRFLAAVNRQGGRAGIARSGEQAVAIARG